MKTRLEDASAGRASLGDWPARCSVPSWVVPGTYLENLRFLADKPVGGVELLFFIHDAAVARLFDEEFPAIREFSERFVYTVHLPENLGPEHEALVEKLAPLVRHFVAHPAKDAPEELARLLNAWAARYETPARPRFLLENTGPDLLEKQLPLLDERIGVCLDTGHLLEQDRRPAQFMARHAARIREIHLHALDRQKAALDGRLPDHRPLRQDTPWLQDLLPALRTFRGIVNLEVFSWEEAAQSLQAIEAIRGEVAPPPDL